MKGSGSLRQEGQVQVPERGAGPGKSSKISQGPWTRVRPLQRDELDAYTAAGIAVGEIIWGIRNNLCKVMAYLPRMTQTEVQYANSFIFDPPIFRGGVQETGFNDRFLKELVISRTSLFNRSRYSVTHHTFMGIALFKSAGRYEEGVSKLLHLHEHEKHPETYTEYERAVLDYTVKVAGDPHEVTDEEFERLRLVLRKNTVADGAGKQLTGGELDRFVDARIVELTWLIGHYCLLNRWFTVLQVPDETAADEDNFPQAYEAMVPLEIRQRNEALLAGTAPSPGLESKPMTRETHPNETLMKQYVDAWLRGDVAAAEAFYADDVRLHHFGHNPLAGEYIGKPALQEYLKKMLAVTDHAATLKVYNVFANDTAGVTVIRVRFERSGRAPLEGKRVTLFEIGPDRKIHDVWVRDEDQYAVDAFFS